MVKRALPTWSFIATCKNGDDVAYAFVWCSLAGYAHPEVRAVCESSTLDRLRADCPDGTDLETRWVYSELTADIETDTEDKDDD